MISFWHADVFATTIYLFLSSRLQSSRTFPLPVPFMSPFSCLSIYLCLSPYRLRSICLRAHLSSFASYASRHGVYQINARNNCRTINPHPQSIFHFIFARNSPKLALEKALNYSNTTYFWLCEVDTIERDHKCMWTISHQKKNRQRWRKEKRSQNKCVCGKEKRRYREIRKLYSTNSATIQCKYQNKISKRQGWTQ